MSEAIDFIKECQELAAPLGIKEALRRLAAAERVIEQTDELCPNEVVREAVRGYRKAYSSKPVPMFCTNCGEPAPTGPTTTNERAYCPKCSGESWAGTYDLNSEKPE